MKYLKIALLIVVIIAIAFVVFERVHAPAVSDNDIIHYSGKNASDMIIVDSLRPGDVIASPLKITGKVRGGWAFEASFPIVLTDWDGKIIAELPATLKGDWMTNEFVPFEATVNFTAPQDIGDFSDWGSLILKKDNPSGLPENDAAAEMRVRFR